MFLEWNQSVSLERQKMIFNCLARRRKRLEILESSKDASKDAENMWHASEVMELVAITDLWSFIKE